MDSLWILVLGMAFVTYLPRMLPLVILQDLRLPPYLKRFFEFIPFAILGALIFPGILYSTDSIESAIFGGVVAAIMAYLKANIFIVVFSGIGAVYLWNLVF